MAFDRFLNAADARIRFGALCIHRLIGIDDNGTAKGTCAAGFIQFDTTVYAVGPQLHLLFTIAFYFDMNAVFDKFSEKVPFHIGLFDAACKTDTQCILITDDGAVGSR